MTRRAWRSLPSVLQGPSLASLQCILPPRLRPRHRSCPGLFMHHSSCLHCLASLVWCLHICQRSSPASIRSLTYTSITWTPCSIGASSVQKLRSRCGRLQRQTQPLFLWQISFTAVRSLVTSASRKLMDCVGPCFALNVIFLSPRSCISDRPLDGTCCFARRSSRASPDHLSSSPSSSTSCCTPSTISDSRPHPRPLWTRLLVLGRRSPKASVDSSLLTSGDLFQRGSLMTVEIASSIIHSCRCTAPVSLVATVCSHASRCPGPPASREPVMSIAYVCEHPSRCPELDDPLGSCVSCQGPGFDSQKRPDSKF